MRNRDGVKAEIRSMLEAEDYEGLRRLSEKGVPVVRHLLGMTYDKGEALSWRAMDAVGRLTAAFPAAKTRNTVQRVLWMMRDESGGTAWSAPEVIGEIIRNNPGDLEDMVPVVISFYEEELFRSGVLRAMARIAGVRADLVEPFRGVPLSYLSSREPAVRGNAVLALAALGGAGLAGELRGLLGDEAEVEYYDGRSLVRKAIGALAREAAGLA